ncbi:hypothetical protein [Legionella jamestowniensis]|uniref:Uncharacterized protein n=1 Tax=Legionella jamestowniensis TaxID=455 RepID=A0A0W0UTW4_9GAMM|nr:hypothetical protein [Legionella jamestowniensis]KTD11314.1 hypothetical protein Ljam_0508 [Legionella jamestowniensis]OCH98825.1 hypothetical protein A8135_11020 [Legionella jamestowniensis]SFL69217.1 hypothetical protein SAMN02746073_1405 [Legionella jamestowniensis DSM 19215]
MNALSDRIKQAITANQIVSLELNNGLKIDLNASEDIIRFLEGNGSDYLEVSNTNGSLLYNLNMTIAIKITGDLGSVP